MEGEKNPHPDVPEEGDCVRALDDISEWPVQMDKKTRDYILKKGLPCSKDEINYPEDSNKRHFSNFHYSRSLPNGEKVRRQWLVYSPRENRVYCFCCKLFAKGRFTKFHLASDGCNDWQHISQILKDHEESRDHLYNYRDWQEIDKRFKTGSTIDKENQKLIDCEKHYWQHVLERLLAILQYLAEHNLAIRGKNEILFKAGNGNFLGLVQLLGKFDHVMMQHIERVLKSPSYSVNYLGKNIQNQLLDLMASRVQAEVIANAKRAKYYAIILDCTPDISRKEQMSFCFRFVDLSAEEINVSEHFVKFLQVSETTGEKLTTSILSAIEECGLDIQNCRGQGYDNGSNMKGHRQGVQRRILEINPRASFMPCGCHSLNLVISDAAKTSVDTVTLFGVLQRIYVIFSSSTKRWDLFKTVVKGLTVKEVCETRWESRIDAVKVLRYQICDISDALIELRNSSKHDDALRSEAESLAEKITEFKFLMSLVIWFDILDRCNVASKMLQHETIDLPSAVAILEKIISFLQEYRNSGFQEAKLKAKEMAENLGVSSTFPTHFERRVPVRKRQFDYECQDEPLKDPEHKFKVQFFIPLIDIALNSVEERFSMLKEHSQTWNFLYDLSKLGNREELLKSTKDLTILLSDGDVSDINGIQLCDELLCLRDVVSTIKKTPKALLNFIHQNGLQDIYPNTWIALRILLTVPITVATGERSFSKLKLIKTYLRSTMSQERLNSLAILSIENDYAQKLDFSEIISKFASLKSRKVLL